MLALAQFFFAAAAGSKRRASNVILITVDTVRADHLGCYGAKNIQTPTLDALAHDGVVFDRAISQVPLTWPSHTAILTGLYPFQNGVQDFTGQPLDARFRSVAQAFQQNGYATGAVVSAFVLDRSWGLARGFTFYDDAFSAEAFANRDLGLVDRRAGESVDHALAFLKKNPKRPFFFWLHLYDPHSPYDPPEPFHSQYQGHLYDGEIAYADHELGRLMAWLKRNQLYDSSLIVFVSDHGESLGEHGEHEHGFFIYDSTIHVPLIVKPPAGSGIRPGRVSRPVETTAIAPTLLRGSGIHDAVEQQFSSRDLLQKDPPGDAEAYSETFYPFSSFGWSPLHALETNRFHFIDAPQPELYDLSVDPEENNNVAVQQPGAVAVLKDKLETQLRKKPYTPTTGNSSGLSADGIEKLRALGYVAYRSPVPADALAALADPKTKLWEFNSVLEAEDALRAGDVAKGKSLLLQVRDKDPELYVVPFVLGETALGQQQWDEAATELRKCLDLNPHFDQAMLGLARALIFLGKTDEGRQWSKKAIDYNPENYRAWYQLGFIDARTDKKQAIADYEKAVSIQPSFAPLQRDLGQLLYQEENYSEAAKHLSRAVELGLKEANLYNSLGICYSRIGRLREAVVSYKQALALDPKLAQTHLNLGFAYERLHENTLATAEYKQACELKSDLCELIKKHGQ
ncbi:MAG TPA: sulfatase-like hydrolase/transferase [Candidatus Sulfotelmatobacter sp.]